MNNYLLILNFKGLSDRIWCGNGANPEGVFVSFMAGVNPFRYVPIIKDWLLNITVRIHASLSTDPYSEPSINVLTDIIDLRKLVLEFGDLINNFISRVGDKLKNTTISLLHDFRNITLSFEKKLKDIKREWYLPAQHSYHRNKYVGDVCTGSERDRTGINRRTGI
jgi:hypothetical protein